MQVLPLAGNHELQSFDCGRETLNDWLCHVAHQHQNKGLSNMSQYWMKRLSSSVAVLTLRDKDCNDITE